MTSNPFDVRITSPALRALARLEPKFADAVLRFLEGPLTENPLRVTKPLGSELEGQRSGYVGIAYRVVVRVDEPAGVVYVLRIAHRADVQAALLSRVSEQPAISLATGARVIGIAIDTSGVTATVEAEGRTVEARGDLLVGADGVWSSIRALLASQEPGFANSRFSGELAWRSTVAADSAAGRIFSALGAGDCVTTFLHSGFHMVAYPVSGGEAFNLVAFTRGERIAEGWSGHADPAILSGAMRGTAPALLRLAKEAAPWIAWPIHTVEQRQWTTPRSVALIGDAAHAMTPFAAQGAVMAIEDAAMLAGTVADFPGDPAQSLAVWENLRRPRIAKVARRGALNRLAWHATGPVAIARNLFVAAQGPRKLASDLDWLYGWEQPKIVRR